MADTKKNCAKQGRTIVFIDESGVSERPHRVRTWAPKGQTPILQYSFTWNQLSAVAGVTFWNIYFKLVNGAVRAPELVAFLKNLRRHLRGRKLLIIWDRLQAHRSRLVRDYVETEGGDIQLEFLPPYAPELNPVEYLWAHWKQHEMPNFCPKDFAELCAFARAKLKRTQRRKTSRRRLLETGRSPILMLLCLSKINRSTRRRTRLLQRVGAGESIDRGKRIGDPAQI